MPKKKSTKRPNMAKKAGKKTGKRFKSLVKTTKGSKKRG